MIWHSDDRLPVEREIAMGRPLRESRQWSTQDPQRLAWFEALYDAHHRRAYGLAFMLLRDVHDAEDVLQEAFLGVWRSGQTPSPDDPGTRAWLLRIVRNRAIDVLRARRRLPAPGLDDHSGSLIASDRRSDPHAEAERNGVHELLGRLPQEQRQVMEMAYFAGLTHGEIADRLDLPLGTVKGRIRLALDRLAGRWSSLSA
jgi:RNA polymerase sigma-70 factor (ECF subfamily)